MQADYDSHIIHPHTNFYKLYYVFPKIFTEVGVGVNLPINVISANFITKAKSTFAQAFAGFAPALA